MSKVRLYEMRMHTKVLGPGTRTAIWFQGCNKNCKGCMSPKARDLSSGTIVEIDEIVENIKQVTDIEGITISGGEPFLQVDALHELLKKVKEETNLGVIIYTGMSLSEITEMKNNKANEILSGLADLIIDGDYIEELNDGGSLRGSSNQNLVFITDRYKPYKDLYGKKKRDFEVIVEGTKALIIGIPNKEELESWKNKWKKQITK